MSLLFKPHTFKVTLFHKSKSVGFLIKTGNIKNIRNELKNFWTVLKTDKNYWLGFKRIR